MMYAGVTIYLVIGFISFYVMLKNQAKRVRVKSGDLYSCFFVNMTIWPGVWLFIAILYCQGFLEDFVKKALIHFNK